MDVEGHVAGGVSEDGIGMCGGVVEELSDGDGGCFCAFGLGGSEGAECDEHSGVNCAGKMEEDSDDLLEASERFGRERWGGVVGVGVLDCGAIGGSGPGV